MTQSESRLDDKSVNEMIFHPFFSLPLIMQHEMKEKFMNIKKCGDAGSYDEEAYQWLIMTLFTL